MDAELCGLTCAAESIVFVPGTPAGSGPEVHVESPTTALAVAATPAGSGPGVHVEPSTPALAVAETPAGSGPEVHVESSTPALAGAGGGQQIAGPLPDTVPVERWDCPTLGGGFHIRVRPREKSKIYQADFHGCAR